MFRVNDMRFYRVHPTTEGGNSAGFQFFTTRHDANKFARQYTRDNPDESAEIDVVEVTPTKLGILDTLNRYASHELNG
jgi:hypothetical protein